MTEQEYNFKQAFKLGQADAICGTTHRKNHASFKPEVLAGYDDGFNFSSAGHCPPYHDFFQGWLHQQED